MTAMSLLAILSRWQAATPYANAVLVRGPIVIEGSSVLSDMPSPERALVAKLLIGDHRLQVGSWSAPPGVSWGKQAKGRQVNRFAAWLRERPTATIIGIDRNSPKWERHDLEDDEWWNRWEPLLYGPRRVHDLRDVYRDYLYHRPKLAREIRESAPDGPLAVTHVRRGVPCRYDAISASPEFEVDAVDHLWDESKAAGSDHALVRAVLRGPRT